MITSDRIPIVRREGVTLYGRVIGAGGKIGRFEVISDLRGNNGEVYNTYADAEKRFNALASKKSVSVAL